MSKVYKTAQGKSIDIDNLRLANEETIAVGNMRVNARGDQVGPGGKIIAGRNQVMDQHYAAPANPQAKMREQVRAGATPTQGRTVRRTPEPELDPAGESFDPPMMDPAPVPTQPQLRGNLADSILRGNNNQ